MTLTKPKTHRVRGLVKGSKGLGKQNVRLRKRGYRVFARFWLGICGVIQCGLLLSFNLNAANGALLNFWTVFLLGALFESLLGIDDIRGVFRQIIVAMIFIFI